MKYKTGDIVLIKKIFCNKPHGHWVLCEPFLVEITKVQMTPSFGPGYLLKDQDGQNLPVYYWEEDIEGRVDEIKEE